MFSVSKDNCNQILVLKLELVLKQHVLVGQNLLLVQDFYYELFTFDGLQKTFLIFFSFD